jgi:hypothetical protein
MEAKRQSLIKRCNERIREITFCNQKDEEMLSRIKEQGDTSYVRNQINKTNEKIKERNIEVDELKRKLIEIPRGVHDNDIQSNIDNNSKVLKEKQRINTEKRLLILKDKKEKSEQSQKFYQASLKSDREQRYLDNDYKRSYIHYLKACASIPDYILNNLKEMPENKGYYWKNVACFGELPAERGKPSTLFERQRGGILNIHEWTEKDYNLFTKVGKEKKKLISSVPRKRL